MEPIIRTPAISAVRRRLTRFSAPVAGAQPSVPGGEIKVEPIATASAAAPVVSHSQNAQALEFDLQMKLRIEQDIRQQVEQEMKLQVEQEVAALKLQAERRGFVSGHEKGEETARKALSEQMERFASIAASLYLTRESVLHNAETVAVEMVYTAVCKIIGELAVTREAVASMVGQMLSTYQQNDELIVYLNPQDLELMQAGDAPRIAAIAPHCQLRADPSIRLGGCIVESPSGTLDARFETQLTHLRETLLAVRKDRETPGETS